MAIVAPVCVFAQAIYVQPQSDHIAPATPYQQPIQQRVIQQPQATQKYNPMNGRFETTYEDSELNYNAFEGDWEYTRPNAKPVYNPFEGKWEFPK